MSESEKAWIDLAQQGDAEAFTSLVEAYQGPVYNLCYRMLGDSYEAEDAAQEVFFRVYRSISRYDKNRSFSTWLLSIAAHYCIDQLRRRRITAISFDKNPYDELPDPAPQPEHVVKTLELQNEVQGLLGELHPTDRAAVALRYWYDLSYEEIAETLDLTVSAVKSRLHRSRRALAQSWAERSEEILIPGKEPYEAPAF